jgi:hypothetical protein
MRVRDPLVRVPCLYHFTDVRNIPYIRKDKAILCTAKLREKGYDFFSGGNDWSLEQDQRFGMDCYVHLCWTRGHPMEWHIRQRDAGIRIIYLQIDRSILYEPGVLFTPGVANAVGMTSHSIPEAVEGDMIDFEALYENIGSLKEAGPQARRQKAERAEILVPKRVSIKLINNLPNG